MIESLFLPQPILDLLYTNLWGIFDLWLIIHLISGFLLGLTLLLIFGKKTRTFRLLISLLVLISFEAIEWILMTQGTILQETPLNTLLDILVGMIGVYLIELSLSKRKRKLFK